MSEGGGRKFFLKERLGAGAFGEVYLAEQDSGAGFRKRVALKVLNAHVKGFAEAGRRMRDEARILGRLSHRNIVSVLDLVKLGDQWAVVMDYIPGVDLERGIEALERMDEYIPTPAALEAMALVSEAMHAAYHTPDGKGGTLGVVHRDIKPSNVLLTGDGDVKVLDFGVARVNLETRESRTGLRVGTERYMSPQRICGDEDDLPGDIYALGATLAELLLRRPMGRTPVEEARHAAFVDETLAELDSLLEGDPAPKAALLQLIKRSIGYDVSARPAPREFGDALLALARTLPGEALVPFARRFVPRVDDVLGNSREAVEGVLSESSTRGISAVDSRQAEKPPASSVSGMKPSETPSAAPRASGTAAPTFDPESQAASNRPAGMSVAVLVGGLLLGLGGLGVAVVAVVAAIMFSGGQGDVALGGGDPLQNPPVTTPITPPPVTPPPVTPPPVTPPDPVVTTPPDPVVAPVTTEPVVATTEPVGTKPKPKPTPTVVAPTIDPNAPRVEKALFVMQDASSISATCGDRSESGTASVRVKDFPVGKCTVEANVVGKKLSATVTVDRATTITCTVSGDSLQCQ